MVFIKSGEIIIPYQKKAIVCSVVFIKSGEIIIPKDLHLIMGQKHLIWDRVWDVKSRKSNLYNIYIYDAPMVLFLHENPLTSNLDIVDIPRYTDMYIYISI